MVKKYAIVIDEDTKQCNVGLGENVAFYKSIGMTQQNVEQAYNNQWYLTGHAPEPPAPTYEEVDQARIQYRKTHIDDRTLARQRKQANGTWTQEDEEAYLALDAEVTAYIEEHFPYPEE